MRHFTSAMLLGLAGVLAPSVADAIDPSYSGSWYRPSESGSGFNLEIFSDDRALLFWYTYNDDGQPVWLYSEGVINGDAIDFDAYYADGMRFSELDSADKNNRLWGSLLMEFTDCNTATISYDSILTGVPNSPEGTREVPVQRLVNIASLPCRSEAAGVWQGAHFDPTLNAGAGAWADLTGVLTQDGRMFFSSDLSEEVFVGTYEVVGSSAVFDYRICEDSQDGPCVAATGSAQFASRDFIRGTGTSAPWGTQPFTLQYRTIYDRSPTLASLAGSWVHVEDGVTSTLVIDGAGGVTGSDTQGCTFVGQVSAIDENFNAFTFAGGIRTCESDDWEGIVVNIDELAGDRRRLVFRLDTGEGAIAFTLTRS